MLNRSMYKKLLDWKKNSKGKTLLIDGARQTGKTFLIEQFAKAEYPDYAKVDFLENSSASTYLADAKSANQVIEALGLLTGKAINHEKTLIFFDEVQKAQNLVTLSKYLVQDGRFDLVMSGSILGVELNQVRSFPVGYLRTETMYPLTFLEFCEAQGVPETVLEQVKECFEKKKEVETLYHDRLIQLFRLYLVIGGMPEAVQTYLDKENDLGAVRETQQELVRLYREDIAKYAGERALQVKAIYDAIPSQLDKENKRFQLKSLKTQAKFERYANDFAWCTEANIALKTTNVTEPKAMLERTKEENRFKLYCSDIGMLMSRYRGSVALSALSGAKQVNFGGIYENVVAQELAAAGVALHYYHNTKKGEVDFLIETDEGSVVPIEVKSGKDYKRHVALNNLMKSKEYSINCAYVLSEANVSIEQREGGQVFYLPLYMLPFIANEAKGNNLEGVKASAPKW